MSNQEIINEFCRAIGSDNVLLEEPMKYHTTFRIGGPADYYLCPHSKDEISKVVQICRSAQIPYYIIGNGSNLLVSDKGVRGAIIQIYRNFNQITVEGDTIYAQSGALLSQVAKVALEHELAGFEFAAGIPGTIGGAVTMNAGAYGGEMKDVLLEATVLTKEGELKILTNEALELGYRNSCIKLLEYTVIEVAIRLVHGEAFKISENMKDLKNRRVEKQPLDMPSAGSTFKRPQGAYAGALIDQSGLRGFQVGGAKVSEKHCGFVVNAGEATALDVLELISAVQKKVKEDSGFDLEPEVKIIGEF